MTVGTFNQPNNTTMDPTTYKGSIDGSFAALVGIAGQFAPHQQVSANMTVVVDAGSVLNGTALTSKSQQSTGVIAAPASNPRIDRVVIDTANGTVSVITGTENATPVAPALTTGKAPVAQVLLQTTSNSITNSMIVDERNFYNNTVLNATTATNTTNASGQIPFPSAQNPSADPNTLDDYEEGTWVPTITFGSLSTGITYTTQVGTYTKIGRLVRCKFHIKLSNKGSITGQSAFIAGFPFSTSFTQFDIAGPIYWQNLAAPRISMKLFLYTGGGLLVGLTAAATSEVSVTDADFTNNTELYGSVVIEVGT
jgi:hypothetical protein